MGQRGPKNVASRSKSGRPQTSRSLVSSISAGELRCVRSRTAAEALAGPNHEEREVMRGWVGGRFDPHAFSAREVNRIPSSQRLCTLKLFPPLNSLAENEQPLNLAANLLPSVPLEPDTRRGRKESLDFRQIQFPSLERADHPSSACPVFPHSGSFCTGRDSHLTIGTTQHKLFDSFWTVSNH